METFKQSLKIYGYPNQELWDELILQIWQKQISDAFVFKRVLLNVELNSSEYRAYLFPPSLFHRFDLIHKVVEIFFMHQWSCPLLVR